MNGYKIIDFKGQNLADGSIEGIYNKVDTATKPLVFCNYTVGDSDEIQKPFFAGIGMKSTYSPRAYQYSYTLAVNSEGAVTLYIKDDDTITIDVI